MNHTSEHGYLFHLQRQRIFYTKCLQHLKRTSSAKFVAVFDSDERFTYNTPLKNIHHSYGDAPTHIRDTLPRRIGRQNETFAHWLHDYYHHHPVKNENDTTTTTTTTRSQFVMNDKSLCMAFPILRFTGKEEAHQQHQKENNSRHSISATVESHSVINALYTLNYQPYMTPDKDLPGKSFVKLDDTTD